jgi:hypothetical protein
MSDSARAQIAYYWSQIQKKDAEIARLTAERDAEREARKRAATIAYDLADALAKQIGQRRHCAWPKIRHARNELAALGGSA